ncbi:MAG: hypothetical protein NXI21_01705 [Alphaproteobacteria bacterium]|nr:hypothetical protein [Alphaproteobacteria bacterium]
MSRPNDRNYQLKLIYNDEDLRRPKHDEIMHWLDRRLADPAFTETIFGPKFRRLTEVWRNELVSIDDKPVAEGEKPPAYIVSELDRAHPVKEQEDRSLRAGDELPPPKRHRWLKNHWEYPLQNTGYGGRRQVVGFLDLVAHFELDQFLRLEHTRRFSAQKGDTRYGWRFTELDASQEWRAISNTVRLGFEVKTEIRSVGELMRQLQLYCTTETLHLLERVYVVGPPHPEAQDVLRRHGFHFIEVPEKASDLQS